MQNHEMGSMQDHLDLLKKKRAGGADITIILNGGRDEDDEKGESEMAPEAPEVEGQNAPGEMPVQGDPSQMSEEELQALMGSLPHGMLAKNKMMKKPMDGEK